MASIRWWLIKGFPSREIIWDHWSRSGSTNYSWQAKLVFASKNLLEPRRTHRTVCGCSPNSSRDEKLQQRPHRPPKPKVFAFWPITEKACRPLSWSALSFLISREDTSLGGRGTCPGSRGCARKSLNRNCLVFSVSLFVLLGLHHRVLPTPAQHSASPSIYIRKNRVLWRVSFWKGKGRERSGIWWLLGSREVTVGDLGRVHRKREFIVGCGQLLQLNMFSFSAVGGSGPSIYRACIMCQALAMSL